MNNLFITPLPWNNVETRLDWLEKCCECYHHITVGFYGNFTSVLRVRLSYQKLLNLEEIYWNFELPGVNKIAKSSVINDQMVAICFATSSQGLLFTLRGWRIWLQSWCMSLTSILLVRDEQFQALIRFRVSGFKHIKHFSTHEDSKHSLPSFSS